MNELCFISHSSKDAPIAQLICHRLEESGIPCWIAPRDIKTSDWAGSIMEGLAKSSVFVIVVSENSIDSGEVTKEITEATHTCEYIIPFKVDTAQLTPRMRYHLGPCHWLDASCPPLEEKVNDLIKRIQNLGEEDKVYMNARRLTLKENIVWPKSNFVGRDAEIQEIEKRLADEKVLFLQGMGGIGKSEIAKSYAKIYADQYDTVIFAGYQGSILDLIIGDGFAVTNLAPWNAEIETNLEYFNRKMEAIRKLSSERVLVILDNYDVDDDELFCELANAPFRMLVTTRNDHEDYESLKIGPISDFQTVRELFLSHWGKTPKEEENEIIDEILRLINCHTITVELLAKQMKASRRKPAEMLQLLRQGGTNTQLKEKVKYGSDVQAGPAFEYIRRLFHFSDLGQEHQRLLRYMTIVPYTGIDIGLFYDICELESYDELNELLAHSWLMLEEDTDILSIHPIVADVVREELKPAMDNCEPYIRGVTREIGNLWFATGQERAASWPLYAAILAAFPQPSLALWRQYSSMSSNAWICGRYALSIEIGHNVLSFVQREMPDDDNALGLAARNLGGCYHNSGDDISAEPYYEMGLEAQKRCIDDSGSIEELSQISTSYQKVGRCAYLRGDFQKSRECLEEALRISDLNVDEIRSGCDTLVELARMSIALSEYEKALEYSEQAFARLERVFGKETPNHAYVYTDMGRCNMALGNYEEAEKTLNEALRINMEYHGENSIQTFLVKKALAQLADKKGEKELADRLFLELEIETERNFGEKSRLLEEIRTLRG